ncbi:MAG: glycosyltransferase, partial [Desulfofustis sp.]|nr:glycosyltransferase [Desulfofustis sp.]
GLTLDPLSTEQAVEELAKCLSRPTEGFHDQAGAIAQQMPAIKLTFGSTSQFKELGCALSYIVDDHYSESELSALLTAFQPRSVYQVPQSEAEHTTSDPAQVPEATPSGAKKVLTIGMATYDDYDGVYFTVQAIRMYPPEITNKTEILVIDNQPDGPAARELKNLDKIVANYRYFPFGSRNSTAVRDLVFRQANADFVLCLDSHVMLMPGTLQRLIDYFEANPDCNDLLQGPMVAENLNSLHTHFEPVWTKGMYGFWGNDERAEAPAGPPFEIPMQGLGLFACRKDAWVGFNPRFRGFGGEEGYLHEKFRQRGGRALCLPFLRWLHRFARPGGVPYPINWHDRMFNYMVGIRELGLDPNPMREHFREHLGEASSSEILKVIDQEIHSPFYYFDAIYCLSRGLKNSSWRTMVRRFQAMGIAASVRHFRMFACEGNAHLRTAMSHRAILQEAMQQGLENVLIFADDALFLNETMERLSQSINELKQREWNLFFLGGQPRNTPSPSAVGCSYLSKPTELGSIHSVAYSKRAFEKIASDLPDSQEAMTTWLSRQQGYENYLMKIDGKFIATPSVTTTALLLDHEDERYRSRFTLGEKIN